MLKLKEMDDITRNRCGKCDYMNSNVPINKKTPGCKSVSGMVNCELYLMTNRIDNRIEFLKGNIGPIFVCGEDGYVECYELF